MTNRGFAILLIMLLAGSRIVVAQSRTDAEQFYSSGVQAFNSQRYAEAIGFFNKIADSGTQDPRAFFFRGLSWSRLGHAMAATADFETAARMELTVAGQSYSVPKALERIQGRERTAIEQYRRAAKRAWEAEQNVRKQDEFLSQKSEDMKFYQSIIESGRSETPSPVANVSDITLPFGAQPVTPFVANQQTFRTRTAPNVSQGGLSEDNQFFDDVNRVTPVEQPEDTKPKAPPKPQDPGERGIFDFDSDDEEIGFDVNFQQPGGNSPKASGGRNVLLNHATSVYFTDENGSSFGKGFASLFKKSGGGASPSQPAVRPQPAVAPSNQESTFDDFGGDDDPFGNPFDE